jgi:hypothetical protein
VMDWMLAMVLMISRGKAVSRPTPPFFTLARL